MVGSDHRGKPRKYDVATFTAARAGVLPAGIALPFAECAASTVMMALWFFAAVTRSIGPASHASPRPPIRSRPQPTGSPPDASNESMPDTAADHFEAPPQPPVHEPPAASFMEVEVSRAIRMSGATRPVGIMRPHPPVFVVPAVPVNGPAPPTPTNPAPPEPSTTSTPP